MASAVRPGATEYFPDGKVRKEDEGALRLAVFTDSDKKAVVIRLGSHVRWLTLDKDTAKALGEAILREAERL